MAKISGLSKRERALAERIGNGRIGKAALSDMAVLGIGFVIARRTDPTIALQKYLDTTSADDVRATLEDLPGRKSSDAGGDK